MLPPAPVRFSTVTGTPQRCARRSAKTRATTSTGPPAENATTSVSRRLGKSSARTSPITASAATTISIRSRHVVGLVIAGFRLRGTPISAEMRAACNALQTARTRMEDDPALRYPDATAGFGPLPADQRAPRQDNAGHREAIMPASLRVSACLAPAVAAILLLGGPDARIAAQPAGLYINAVDLDINPADMDAYMAALRENGAKSVTEPGCREFNIHVKADSPNHVFIYEIYDNAAALEAHRATDHFKKYAATTAKMVVKREVRAMTSVAFNYKAR